MVSLGDLLGSQITGPIVFPPEVEVAGVCLMILSEVCGGDVKIIQDLPGGSVDKVGLLRRLKKEPKKQGKAFCCGC